MYLSTQLLLGIRELSYMHRLSASELLSMKADHLVSWSESLDLDALLKYHILSRECLNLALEDLGIDALRGSFDPQMPLKRTAQGFHAETSVFPEFPNGIKIWYKRFSEYYRALIQSGSLTPNIERLLFDQLWAIETLNVPQSSFKLDEGDLQAI